MERLMVIKRIVLEGAILQYTVFVAKIEIAEVHSANDIEARVKFRKLFNRMESRCAPVNANGTTNRIAASELPAIHKLWP
jgi:hypothetical protein